MYALPDILRCQLAGGQDASRNQQHALATFVHFRIIYTSLCSLHRIEGRLLWLKLMAIRQTKLEFYDHPVTCPYCHVEVVFTSMMERIILARRTCPACKVEMLIEDGRAVRIPVEGHTKKPSGKIRRQAR